MKVKRSIRNLISRSHWQDMIEQAEYYSHKADDAVEAMRAEFGDNPKFEALLDDAEYYMVTASTLGGACLQMSGVNVLEVIDTLAE